MKILKAFRYRLEPTEEQARQLSRYRGCMRFVWNKALALQKGRVGAGYPLLSYGDLAKLLTLWRHSEEYAFLRHAPVHPLQWTLKFLMQSIHVAFDPTLALSNGTFVDAPGWFRRYEAKVAWEMRKLARMKKFSKNWREQVAKIQRLHAHIANARFDFLHKTSTAISKNHAMVFVEDLHVKNMSKSAKGTKENPGKKVRAKSGLNKAILDQGWSMFQTLLTYKLAWRGGYLKTLPAPYTSLTCPIPTCGHASKGNRITQADFTCEKCGYHANADTVGAMNVLRAGLARIACLPA